MTDLSTNHCEGFELLASGNFQRLERWGGIIVQRPESEATQPWLNPTILPSWQGHYDGVRASGGRWQWLTPFPDPCIVSFGPLRFLIKPTASKHLGLFPEQALNWSWIYKTIASARSDEPIRVLNLFGYTGGATLAAALAGASVTHVDAARAMVGWCAENARLSGLASHPIRFVVEDALKYLHREIRRGNRYDAIIMDPPSFGRGKGGEVWKLSEHLADLLDAAHQVLSNRPLFLLLNTYSNLSAHAQEAVQIQIEKRFGGTCEIAPLSLQGSLDQRILPCGISHRWSFNPEG